MLDTDKPLDPKDEKKLNTRGIGSGICYEPFIKIHEINSKGESYRIRGRNTSRAHHLLSRLEFSAFLVFDRFHLTYDIKEQFPLPIIDTLSICARLGIKHPQIRNKLKVVTTDLVVELKGKPSIAISVNYSSNLDNVRTVEKLQIEKLYWEELGYEWKLFTEQEIPAIVKENLEWLHAASQNSPDLYKELSFDDIATVISRLSNSDKTLSTVCAAMDDKYECKAGFHIGVIRNAAAANLIDVPLNIVFRNWRAKDVSMIIGLDSFNARLSDVS
ncbi:heteromeric transposase endonuclease subunit TnsA [Maribrevibacterium harenarium]|uniref:Heteromeric transposase endonuclease subunit TnsA n=1 Tax=Maribrevibacterium harenarium TaxID=2589817 RepID=A0A501X057_9GAMM|nr:TnsA endonuclease N-terminal domain-containing protein [Maribrevibacterium harenarium]TPE54264.1 heteromeric transposase endonuclease subunit TnsA [Maribrevibacterium harenarium]